jgi:enoyl-CoA hydratase/carnithine racemase
MGYQNILWEKKEGVGYLTLNRPHALNSLSPELVEEMGQVVEEVREDEGIKALVIRGAGRSFCSGADLKFISQAFQDLRLLTTYIERLNDVFIALEALPAATVAVVHGHCLAGGLELAMCCDFILAAEDARIGDQHINFALMPGGGNTQRLYRRLGHFRAMDLLLTGRWLSGREAQAWGLAYRAVPAAELDGALEELLSQLRPKSRQAIGAIKRAVRRGRDLPLREAIRAEEMTFLEYVASSDHAMRGVQAFLEKRTPQF